MPSAGGSSSPVRFTVVLMVSFVRLIVNLDRMAFSFLVVTMASEFDWSTADQGRVKSAFAFGYMFTQIPGGILGDRTGNKKFQSLALAAFALGLCGIPPLISALGTKSSPRVVEYINFAIGFCCGSQHPTMTGLIKKWCLPAEKNWCASMESLATVGGSLVNCLAVAYLTTAMGWRNTMYLLSATTWVALIGFTLVVSDAPTASGGLLPLGAEEAALFRAEGMLADDKAAAAASPKKRGGAAASKRDSDGDSSSDGGSAWALFLNSGTWALILSHAMYNAGRYTFEQEMPKYYSESLQEGNVGMHLASLHVTAFCVSLLLKGRIDGFVKGGGLSLISLRRVAIIAGYSVFAAGCAALAFLAAQEQPPAAYVFTLCLNLLWIGLTVQSFGHCANYYDITRTNTGLLMGVGNTFGTYVPPTLCSSRSSLIAGQGRGWPRTRSSALPIAATVFIHISWLIRDVSVCVSAATVPTSLSPLFVASVLEAAGDDAEASKYAWAQVFAAVGGMALVTAVVYSMFIVVDVVDEDDDGKKKKA